MLKIFLVHVSSYHVLYVKLNDLDYDKRKLTEY